MRIGREAATLLNAAGFAISKADPQQKLDFAAEVARPTQVIDQALQSRGMEAE